MITMLRNVILGSVLALSSFAVFASGAEGVKLDPIKIDLADKSSLQRGARIFVNYCLSCHSAAYMRYNRMGHDLGISDELVKENLLFAADKVGDLMKAVMPRDDAKDWFHAAPPDLTLEARARGPEWIYTYLRSFYRDDATPSGWNNVVFVGVAMPHVLYEWQGSQRAVFKTEKLPGGRTERVFDHFELEKPGSMTPQEFDGAMHDLTNFMVYMAEPAKLVRYKIGVFVLIFLAVFGFIAYLLKKEYWKDVH